MVETVFGYLSKIGYRGQERDVFLANNQMTSPCLLSLRGPMRAARTGYDTVQPGSIDGVASRAFNMLEQRIWPIDESLAWTSIGSAQGLHVVVANKHVSKLHATILRNLEGKWCVRADAKELSTDIIKYSSRVFEEDLKTERRVLMGPGELYVLADHDVIELSGPKSGTRLAWITQPCTLLEYYQHSMKKPD